MACVSHFKNAMMCRLRRPRQKLSAKQVELSIRDAMALPCDANPFGIAVTALVQFFHPDLVERRLGNGRRDQTCKGHKAS